MIGKMTVFALAISSFLGQSAFAQSAPIDIHSEFDRAHQACINFLSTGDDVAVRALARKGYRVKKRGRGISAYLQSSKAIPANRRSSIEVFTGKKIPFSAINTCQIFVGGVARSTNEVLHGRAFTSVIFAGFSPSSGSKRQIKKFKKGSTILAVSGALDRGLYKLVISRVKN